jgi:outer membrane biosynthesis protein TonB
MDRAEKLGLGAATAGHVILFGLLSVGFLATPNPLKIERNPVEVTFAEDVGLEAMAPRASAQPPATSVAPELGEPEPAPPQPAQPAQSQPAPVPPQPAPEPVPAPTPRPAKPPVRQQPKAAPKAAPARPAPAQQRPRGLRLGNDFLKGITEEASVSRTAQASAPAIGPREQASLAAELKRQLKPHWRPPSGADIEKLRVTVVASLREDGSIAGEPRVIGPTGLTPSNRAQAELFVERAVAAVKRGAPYNFPKQYYAAWRVIRPQLYEGL